jgi:hypothetical protein
MDLTFEALKSDEIRPWCGSVRVGTQVLCLAEVASEPRVNSRIIEHRTGRRLDIIDGKKEGAT